MSLARRRPLRAKPRSKGNRGELAVRDMIREFPEWRAARRNWQSGGQGGGDIIEGPAGVHVESKWCETCRIWDWIFQAESEARPTDIPAVFVRDNAHPTWWVIAPDDEIDALHWLAPVRAYVARYEQKTTHLWKWIDRAIEDGTEWESRRTTVKFSRDGERWYQAMEAREFLRLVYLREVAA